MGVLQVSILAPLLFLLYMYINDLVLTCDKHMAVLFADDKTNCLLLVNSLHQIADIMNIELIKAFGYG